jgi:hypothetical protein
VKSVVRKNLIFIYWVIGIIPLQSQVVYEHLSRSNIYDFLDELANAKVIELNSAVKPYSRAFIAGKLQEASGKQEQLTKRQQKEIEFYMKDYRLELRMKTSGMKPLNIFPKKEHLATALDPLGLHYRDSTFALSVRPIWGIRYFFNSNGNTFHRWGGLEGFAYATSYLGAYSSLRDNHEEQALTLPTYLTQRMGVPEKISEDGGIDYSEARGGLMVSWKWGAAGVVKDHVAWGNNYNGSNILSGRTPSFGHIRLYINPVRWFEFTYIHGWLVSDVVDSSRSYQNNSKDRIVFQNKFIAANMFSFMPVKHLWISFGNSIIYSDVDVQLAYLVPFLFYKSVDHTLNSTSNSAGQNSQMFIDISSRNIRNLHLFVSVFIDEFSMERVWDNDRFNFISYKGGARLSNWPLKNLILTGEFTYTLPIVYQHYLPSSTFASNSFGLGHYMADNSTDLFLSARWKPVRGLTADLSYTISSHFNDYVYGGAIPADQLDLLPIMQDLTWRSSMVSFNLRYEILNNAYAFMGLSFSNVEGFDVVADGAPEVEDWSAYYLDRYGPEFFQGKQTTFSLGVNIGF